VYLLDDENCCQSGFWHLMKTKAARKMMAGILKMHF
jgi:hypothetical protein